MIIVSMSMTATNTPMDRLKNKSTKVRCMISKKVAALTHVTMPYCVTRNVNPYLWEVELHVQVTYQHGDPEPALVRCGDVLRVSQCVVQVEELFELPMPCR